MIINLIILILALVSFFASAVGVVSSRVNLQSLGLVFITVYLMLHL